MPALKTLVVACLPFIGFIATTPAEEMIRFGDTDPWTDARGRILNPPVERIDVAEERAGAIRPASTGDWTVAVWNFPAWNPGGKHYPELASRAPLRIPLLYDSRDPEVEFNGVKYYRNDDRRVMDWHVKWMVEHGVNLVMFDWYPSESKERFDNSPRHRHINDSIEVGFLGKPHSGAPPVETNPYADKIDFVCMWTNHGGASVPEGTMEYACKHFLSQPNYHRIDGKPLIIVHAPGQLRDAVGGMEELAKWVTRQREIARSFGHDEIFLALGDIQPRYSAAFRRIGFDGAFNYITPAKPPHVEEIPVRYQSGRVIREGNLFHADYQEDMVPAHEAHWAGMYEAWGPEGFFPTVTLREDWRHWHVNPRMLHYEGCTPDAYGAMLRRAKAAVEARGGRKFVTVGIWNEFYEDAYLEPDLLYGFQYLDRVRDAFVEETP